jgi:selenocysteine lyase/cysteine desulfurase
MLYSSPLGLSKVQSLGHYFNSSTTLENKLGLAGSSYELVASIPSVLAYFGSSPASRSRAWVSISAHEHVLQSTLLNYLNTRQDVTVIGEKDADPMKRVSTISFVVKGRNSQEIVEDVDEKTKGEVGIRWGKFYSNRLAEEVLGLGKDGVVRVSMVHYNTGMFYSVIPLRNIRLTVCSG